MQSDDEINDDELCDPDDLCCSICGGEGYVEGDIPFWNEGELIICYSCGGSGARKDMTCW